MATSPGPTVVSPIETGASLPPDAAIPGDNATRNDGPVDTATGVVDRPMKRVISPLFLTASGVGSTIGAGIFVVTGYVAHEKTGPALILSYAVSGFACALAAYCYAEFASTVPKSGSAYAYARKAFGEAIGFMMGWDLMLEYAVSAASVARGWSSHLIELFHAIGIPVNADVGCLKPPWQKNYETGEFELSGSYIDLPAILIVLVITAITVRGIKESLTFNFVMVIIKVLVVLFVILAGFAFVSMSNLSPFMPYGFFGLSLFGHHVAGDTATDGSAAGVFAGAAVVFFSYIGFDSVTTQTEESRNPQRDLPIAIFGSLGITTALYMLVSFVLVGMVPYTRIDTAAPITAAFREHGQQWMAAIIALGALAGLSSVLLVQLVAQPRILLSMARDDLLPPLFRAVHPEYRTPHRSSILIGSLVAIAAGLVPLEVLVDLVSIGTLMAFALVCLGILVLRYCTPGYDTTGLLDVRQQTAPISPQIDHDETNDSRAIVAATNSNSNSASCSSGSSNQQSVSDEAKALNGNNNDKSRSSDSQAGDVQGVDADDVEANGGTFGQGDDVDSINGNKVQRSSLSHLETVELTSVGNDAPSHYAREIGSPLSLTSPPSPTPIRTNHTTPSTNRANQKSGDTPTTITVAVTPTESVTSTLENRSSVIVDADGDDGTVRKFRVPCVPLIPIAGASFCFLLMISLPWENWLRLVVWWAVGIVVYLLYSRPNAKRLRMIRQASIPTSDAFPSSSLDPDHFPNSTSNSTAANGSLYVNRSQINEPASPISEAKMQADTGSTPKTHTNNPFNSSTAATRRINLANDIEDEERRLADRAGEIELQEIKLDDVSEAISGLRGSPQEGGTNVGSPSDDLTYNDTSTGLGGVGSSSAWARWSRGQKGWGRFDEDDDLGHGPLPIASLSSSSLTSLTSGTTMPGGTPGAVAASSGLFPSSASTVGFTSRRGSVQGGSDKDKSNKKGKKDKKGKKGKQSDSQEQMGMRYEADDDEDDTFEYR